jgi:D-alanine-D-alanine ligase
VASQQRKTNEPRIKVAVVFGGRSSEHAISCVSAGSIMSHLDPDRYEVIPVGITRQGSWVLTDGNVEALQLTGERLPEVESGTALMLPGDPTAGGLVVVEPGEGARAIGSVDVVFPVLHGAFGEDGTLQGLLEMAGVPYVGAGVLSSAVAMDKEYTKKLLRAEGLPVGDYVVVRPGGTLSEADRDRLGLPVFVKPARAGSSIGISKVSDWSQFDAALHTARAIDPKVLVEAAVVGREIECGVLEGIDGGPAEASLPAEIVLSTDWYDFDAKYLDDSCEFEIPAKLSDDTTAKLREMACRAFTALEGSGLARVDFFVGPGEELTINELNTMPGFTEISMFGKAWAATGLEFPALLDRLVQTALRRGTGLR